MTSSENSMPLVRPSPYRLLAKPTDVLLRLASPLTKYVRIAPRSTPTQVTHPTLPTTGQTTQTPTSTTDAHALLTSLHDALPRLRALSLYDKAALLRACRKSFIDVAKEESVIAEQFKGNYNQGCDDDLGNWMMALREMDEMIEALEAKGRPSVEGVRKQVTLDGEEQWVIDVWPRGLDHLLYPGVRAELFLEPGQPPSQGAALRGEQDLGQGVTLVLGAGNQLIVVLTDILSQLLQHHKPVLVKLNPVNDYIGPFLQRAFAPLIAEGFLAFCYGGSDIAKFLLDHELVTSVHMTGSNETFNSILWGTGPDNKLLEKKTPRFIKPMTGELGCCTPYIIVPSANGVLWSQGELDYHANQIAYGLTFNAGHNCLAAQVIITCRQWTQRPAFLQALKRALSKIPNRVPYYPGSDNKYAAFQKRFADKLEKFTCMADDGIGTKPWILASNLSPNEADLEHEYWCGVLQEVVIDLNEGELGDEGGGGGGGGEGVRLGSPPPASPGVLTRRRAAEAAEAAALVNPPSASKVIVTDVTTPAAIRTTTTPVATTPLSSLEERFFERVSNLANQQLWGNLSCSVIAHDKTTPRYAPQFDRFLQSLHYGSVTVNGPTLLGYICTTGTWGSYGGRGDLKDMQSGNCLVHNTLCFDHPVNTIVRCPFSMAFYPPWMPDNAGGKAISQALFDYAVQPNLIRLLKVASLAMRY